MPKPTIKNIAPLQSWDIYSEFLASKSKEFQIIGDVAHLEKLKSQYDWCFETAHVLNEEYQGMVVTDSEQIIMWVNDGFKEMTGYSKKYAVGKHPRFLQGKDTSNKVKDEIRTTLSLKRSVVKRLLNYREDGTPYLCDIKIIPLFNHKKELTHFMALEKKARVA